MVNKCGSALSLINEGCNLLNKEIYAVLFSTGFVRNCTFFRIIDLVHTFLDYYVFDCIFSTLGSCNCKNLL
jgi:hypothetical protein